MTQEPEYEYKGLMAEAWDLLRGDTSQWADRAFYFEAIRRFGEPVLDVGCGTGRLLLDYMAQDIDIDGVDNSPEMLALCREKAAAMGLQPRLYEQYVGSLALPRTYRTILVPSSSLQLLIEPVQVDRALRRLLAHLEEGGAVVASIMTLWKEGDPLESRWETSTARPEDGAIIRREAYSRYDPSTECEATEDLYQLIRDGEVVKEERHRRAPATRSYTQRQIREVFERAGYQDVERYGEFVFEPAKPDDGLFVVVGGKGARSTT